MRIWQVDFYRHIQQQSSKNIVWDLLICESNKTFIYHNQCLQKNANSDWLVEKIKEAAAEKSSETLPDLIQVFRPECLSLLTVAGEKLGIKVEATRHTNILKKELEKRFSKANYNPIKLQQPPPSALPENIWGEKWHFVSIAADGIDVFFHRPIPIKNIPQEFLPINLGIASTTSIPGIIIYGGRQSMELASWLEKVKPASLNYIPTEINKSGGLVLESGLIDRWIFLTFEDIEVAKSAQNYEKRKIESKGLHFLLIQPDDSGMTSTGFWLMIND